MPRKAFGLHVGEMQPEAHMRAAAERHPGETVARALRRVGEAQGIERLGVGPDLRHVVGEQRIDRGHGARRDRIPLEGEVAGGAARDRRHRRLHPHRFLERHLRQRHRLELVERRRLVRAQGKRVHLVAQLCLPLRIGGERADERCQRRGQRVMRRHHQETHVIDDVLGRQQRAVVMGGAAQLREQVFAVLASAESESAPRNI